MAPSPSDSGSASAAQLPSRNIARQACDGCRSRKRRCIFNRDDAVRWANSSNQSSGAGMRCRNCDKANSQCTFLLPLRPRGPKPRTDHRYAELQSSPSENNREAEDQVVNSHAQGQNSFTQQASLSASLPTATTTSVPEQSFEPASLLMHDRSYATDVLFPRDLVQFVLQDYVTYVYPVVPVIHIPTFKDNLSREHDSENQDFLSLVFSLCALTISLLPSRFRFYREHESPLPFKTRTEVANHCYNLNQSLRDIEYWDTVSHQKWASSYLLALTFHQTGNANLWRMLEVESMQLLRLLEVQHSSNYAGLDAIETQLRKKAFWLMFYAYIHHTHSYRDERVTFLDPMILQEIKLEELMPAPVDDEYISSAGILPCPEDVSANSMAAGFIIHSRIFSAARMHNPLCSCPQSKDPTMRIARLQEQLYQLKYMLDTVQPIYRPWNKKANALAPATEDNSLPSIQREVIRANIQTTRLWLQIVLLDQIDNTIREPTGSVSSPEDSASLTVSSPQLPPFPQIQTRESAWDERENVCRELLHAIHSFSRSALEPNGNGLVYKLRDVAVVLLAFPHEGHAERSRRVREYLKEYSELLSILDVSETVNTLSLQSWIDTSRGKATKPPSAT